MLAVGATESTEGLCKGTATFGGVDVPSLGTGLKVFTVKWNGALNARGDLEIEVARDHAVGCHGNVRKVAGFEDPFTLSDVTSGGELGTGGQARYANFDRIRCDDVTIEVQWQRERLACL